MTHGTKVEGYTLHTFKDKQFAAVDISKEQLDEMIQFNGSNSILVQITPALINAMLKYLPDDSMRLQAMEGVCKCGAIPNGSQCWSCYDSGGNY